MTSDKSDAVSRRTFFQVAAIGAGVVAAGLLPVSDAAAASKRRLPSEGGEVADSSRFLTIEEVRAEYRAEIVDFPLSLPAGWSFPPESKREDTVPGALWEEGNGTAEAYFFWQYATAAAAQQAHSRGDDFEADRFLDALEAGYGSPTRRAVLDDPEAVFIREAVQPARRGNVAARGAGGGRDFTTLMQLAAAPA
jgi:hypothetical protein